MRIACIGECMVELQEQPDGQFRRAYGGDTLNTAVYLARLGVAVDYVTALGDDAWSGEMLAAWAAEGVGTGLVRRIAGALPGLYIIQTDANGERRFLYWRDSAAARRLFDHLDPAALDGFGVLYLSGITLSIYDEAGRARLLGLLAAARARGAWVVFDTNFRPRGWPDRARARALYAAVFAQASIVLASTEDLDLLFEDGSGEAALLRHAGDTEIVLKSPEPVSRVFAAGGEAGAAPVLIRPAPVARVVDTTAAGDSFAAGYLAARLRGLDPVRAARAGHHLAGHVVGHRGALMPLAAMPGEFQEDADAS
ncbi:MAG: sugar kinase [Janthinobacterium lividum]